MLITLKLGEKGCAQSMYRKYYTLIWFFNGTFYRYKYVGMYTVRKWE
jgi:hypothetical protein